MKCSITSSLNHKAVGRCIAVVSKWIDKTLLKRNVTSTLISFFLLFYFTFFRNIKSRIVRKHDIRDLQQACNKIQGMKDYADPSCETNNISFHVETIYFVFPLSHSLCACTAHCSRQLCAA